MLSVDYDHEDFAGCHQVLEIQWHVGELDVARRINGISRRVLTLYADGDELNYLIQHFSGLVWSNTRNNLILHGSLAATVAANL